MSLTLIKGYHQIRACKTHLGLGYQEGPLRTLPMPSIRILDLKKSKLGMKKCILAFKTWKTFVFLSNFHVSLTPEPTLINKQIKELHKYHELHVYTEKFRV